VPGRVSLHVDRHGAGPDLVLLHGWGLPSNVWQPVLPRLAARFRVHCVDLPGYRGSRAIPPARFDDAVSLLEEALPDEAIVCGWSLGAQLAIALARRRVRSLVLVSALPASSRDRVGSARWIRPRSMPSRRTWRVTPTARSQVRRLRPDGSTARARSSARRVLAQRSAATRSRSLRHARLAARHDLRAEVTQLACRRSRSTARRTRASPARRAWLAAQMPGARFVGSPTARTCRSSPIAAEFAGARSSRLDG
jgi:pimeloyl-ACP methyl ester carboxylesterase